MLNIPQSPFCKVSSSKVARTIKDYCYWYNKPNSSDRSYFLQLLEDFAREKEITLPTPEQISRNKVQHRFDCDFVAETEFTVPQQFKCYYDGENVVAHVPLTRTSERTVYDHSQWDDLFDSLYSFFKSDPEFDEKGKSFQEKRSIRDRIHTILVKQFYNVYCYDDSKESEPCPLFISRKLNNVYCSYNNRKQRFFRKVRNVKWSYWVTYTYDDDKCTEKEFATKLLKKLQNLADRYCWRYIGVFERGDLNGRLHFHGFIYVPNGAMVGKLEDRISHSYKRGNSLEHYIANTEFERCFGRNSFESLEGINSVEGLAKYTSKMMRYMDTGARFVYSRHIPFDFVLSLRGTDLISKFVIRKKVNIVKYTVFPSAVQRSDLSISRVHPILADDPELDPYCNGLL